MDEDQVIVLEIEGSTRKLMPRRIMQSGSFELYDATTNEKTEFYLKPTQFVRVPRQPENPRRNLLFGSGTLPATHLKAKFAIIQKLGIKTEPYVMTYFDSESETAYVVTKQVGISLAQMCIEAKRNDQVALEIRKNSIDWFNEICRIMAVLHSNGFVHTHPHPGNFTIFNNKIYLIDIASMLRNKNVDWTSFNQESKRENDVYGLFINDFPDLTTTLQVLIAFMPMIDTDEKYRLKVLDGFVRIFQFYPVSPDILYLLILDRIQKMKIPNIPVEILSDPIFSVLTEQIVKLKSANPDFFPELTFDS